MWDHTHCWNVSLDSTVWQAYKERAGNSTSNSCYNIKRIIYIYCAIYAKGWSVLCYLPHILGCYHRAYNSTSPLEAAGFFRDLRLHDPDLACVHIRTIKVHIIRARKALFSREIYFRPGNWNPCSLGLEHRIGYLTSPNSKGLLTGLFE